MESSGSEEEDSEDDAVVAQLDVPSGLPPPERHFSRGGLVSSGSSPSCLRVRSPFSPIKLLAIPGQHTT